MRALIRDRRFAEAVAASTDWVGEGEAGVELLAAHASALYRVQRNAESAQTYRAVLVLDPLHEEAHARLGSGLTAPRTIARGPELGAAIAAMRDGRGDEAITLLQRILTADPDQPVAHRLLGEVLFQRRAQASLALGSPSFAAIRTASFVGVFEPGLAEEFVPGYSSLSAERRVVVERALGMFEPYLGRLVSKGGRHDLLAENERTTDHPSRASLRGRRTFDGRVWDDVRGIGGLRAATGIEALDEAAQFGFDTLVHEIAHQVHLHALRDSDVFGRIRQLYREAVAEGRALDYYAASNWAEYFGQGVEAFASLAKRPAAEATHGHTRFELMRVDPALHDLIAALVAEDPLAGDRIAAERTKLLLACIDAALLLGRVDDAFTAAELLPDLELRNAARIRARAVAVIVD